MKRCLIALALLVAIYAGMYFVVSRRSLAFNRQYGLRGFYYSLPCPPEKFAQSPGLQKIHQWGKKIFYPIWWVDKTFGGPLYISGPPFIKLGTQGYELDATTNESTPTTPTSEVAVQNEVSKPTNAAAMTKD